jgi:hypothetical protein
MSVNTCQAVTKKGTPCKNKSIDEHYCKVHGGKIAEKANNTINKGADKKSTKKNPVDKKAKANDKGDTVTAETSKTYELLVQAAANLIDVLEQAGNHVPGAMNTLFKFTGTQLFAPLLSEKLQRSATEKTHQQLQKLQNDLLKLGSDPATLNVFLERTRRLEKMAVEAVLLGDKIIPERLKVELLKALEKLRELKGRVL